MMHEGKLAKAGVGPLCELFGKTRHAYYDKKWHWEPQVAQYQIVLEMVATLRRELPRLGTHKLYHCLQVPLQKHGIKMGRDKLHKLLQQEGLVLKKHKKYVRTTDSRFWTRNHKNLFKDLILSEAEQAWVSDITYVRVRNDFSYLSLITDAYSKRIVGYYLHIYLDNTGCLNALEMALSTRTKMLKEMVHHSDRGTQYRSDEYISRLNQAGIAISMTQNGDPYENAIAERVNGILKEEFGLGKTFRNHDQASKAVMDAVYRYNYKRPHSSCDYLTPAEAHDQKGALKRRWKSWKERKEASMDLSSLT